MPELETNHKESPKSNLIPSRQRILILLGIWLLALAVRMGMFALYHDRMALLDEPTYGYIFAIRAHNWLNGRGMVGHDRQVLHAIRQAADGKKMKDMHEIEILEPKEGYYPDNYETPGYSVWIAFVWKLFGRERFFDVKLMQALLSSLMVIPIFSIGQRLFNQRIGFMGALVWAFYLPEARFSVMSLRDVWVTWGTILFTWAFVQTMPSKERSGRNWILWSIVAGLLGAVTAYMRSSAVLYIPFVIASAIFLWNVRPLFQRGLIIGAVMFISLFPWAKRNHDLFGRWELRGWFHYALLSGLCEGDPSLYRLDPQLHVDRMDPLSFPDSSRTSIGPDDEQFKQNVINIYKERPLWCLQLAGKRFLKCIFGAYIWGINDDAYLDSRTKPLRERAEIYLHHPFLLFKWIMEKSFYPLAILLFVFFRDRWKSNLVLLAAMLYFPIFHGATIFQLRFILPGTWPVCLVLAQYLAAFLPGARHRPQPFRHPQRQS